MFRSDVVRVSTVSSSSGLITTIVGDVDFVSGLNTTAVVAFGNVKLGLVGPFLDSARSRAVFLTNRFTEVLTRKLYLGRVPCLSVVESVTLFKDTSFFEVRASVVGTDANVNFFFSVNPGVGKRSTSSIFPSDARSAIDFYLSFYSRLSSLRDSVTPVRRREDTEGDGYTRLKVQIDCPSGVLSRMPFELSETTRKARQEKTWFREESLSHAKMGNKGGMRAAIQAYTTTLTGGMDEEGRMEGELN